LTGVVTVVDDGEGFFLWGRPNSNAAYIAGFVSDPSKIAAFAYDQGVIMYDGFAAPHRRVGMFLGDYTASHFTSQGWQLFDNAVLWACNYFRSPLWWRYERRRLVLPRGLRRVTDRIFRVYEFWRVSQGVTRVLGPRFSRSRTLLEIDLTYICSLRCQGCNRSLDKAPSNESISLSQINQFIDESVQGGHRWEGIRILGGEPTLHPEFLAILDSLREYRRNHQPKLRITVVSNGYSKRTKLTLKKIPEDVLVENTSKVSVVQVDFAPFNNAPRDYPEHARSDFRNGCWITKGLGMGLTPSGYYHCAIAGGIDRIYNFKLGP